MFAPNQERTASELLRVCRPGGRFGLASWTPDSFIGQVFRLVSSRVSPPPGLQRPSRWGTANGLRDLLDDGVSDLRVRERTFIFRYRSADHWLGFFRTNFGPVNRAFASLDDTETSALSVDLLALCNARNTCRDGTLVVPSAYLEVVATRRG